MVGCQSGGWRRTPKWPSHVFWSALHSAALVFQPPAPRLPSGTSVPAGWKDTGAAGSAALLSSASIGPRVPAPGAAGALLQPVFLAGDKAGPLLLSAARPAHHHPL